MCEEELLSLFQISLTVHKNKSSCQCSHRSSSQVLHPQPSTALALELCCHMANQRRNCTFCNQLCLKKNWTHMVLPHLFFKVNFINPSHGHGWSQGLCSHPQHELLLLLPSPGHCSQILQGPLQDLQPSSRHKAQPDPGPRAGSRTGPSAAPWEAGLGDLALGENL